jgi:hypothetical protein
MRRLQRPITLTLLIVLSGLLVGCGSMGATWDPTDMLDFLDTKKKLPGERKPVFPQGVPGVEPGVPRELYKGNVEQQQQQDAASLAAQPPVEEPKPAPRQAAKSRSKPTAVSAAPTQDPETAPTEEGGAAEVPPPPKPAKTVRRRTTSLPRDDQATQPQTQATQPVQQTQQQTQQPPAFPAPLPSQTFQR